MKKVKMTRPYLPFALMLMLGYEIVFLWLAAVNYIALSIETMVFLFSLYLYVDLLGIVAYLIIQYFNLKGIISQNPETKS